VTEPDVALTDFALTAECAALAVLMAGVPSGARGLRRWLVLFFGSASAAALLGGIVHGFLLDPAAPGQALLWSLTLLAIGATSLAAWSAGMFLVFPPAPHPALIIAGLAGFVAFAGRLLLGPGTFMLALVAYLPASVALLWGMIAAFRRGHGAALSWGVAGCALVYVAALVQYFRIAPHPVYFNHNALYHVIQGISFWMIFVGCRAALASTLPAARSAW
jgi:hypothetical protein